MLTAKSVYIIGPCSGSWSRLALPSSGRAGGYGTDGVQGQQLDADDGRSGVALGAQKWGIWRVQCIALMQKIWLEHGYFQQ